MRQCTLQRDEEDSMAIALFIVGLMVIGVGVVFFVHGDKRIQITFEILDKLGAKTQSAGAFLILVGLILVYLAVAVVPSSSESTDPASLCRSQTGFEDAGAATAGLFPTLPFPAHALSYRSSAVQNGEEYSQQIQVCSPSLSENSIRPFYASMLPQEGWKQSVTFPYGENPTSRCGDPYCWEMGSSPTYYVSLEQVREAWPGPVVLYVLRLVTLP